MAPTTFPLFTELPMELRLQIWDWAALLPHIIELSWCSNPPSVISITASNPVLHTCSEARNGTIDSFDRLKLNGSSQIIFLHYSVDTIFFGPGCRHLVPSGNTERWTYLNRKLMRDILLSSSLKQNLKIAAFDGDFLMAFDDPGGVASVDAFGSCMERLEEVIIVRPTDWEKAKEECERSKNGRLTLVEGKLDREPYRRAKLDLSGLINTNRESVSHIEKIWLADVAVLRCPVEERSVTSRSF